MADIPKIEIIQEFKMDETFTKVLPDLVKVAAGSCSCECNCSCLCQCMCQCSGFDREAVAQQLAAKKQGS